LTVQLPRLFGAVVVADERDVNRGTLHHPVFIGPGKKDVARLFDPFKDAAVRAAPDALRGEESHPFHHACLDHGPGFFVPIGDQISLMRHPTLVDAKECIDVVIAEIRPHELATKERRVADDDRSLRPVCFSRSGRIGQVKHRVAALNVVERAKDRVTQIGKAVAEHPLNLADPDDNAGKLGGVGVEFDPKQRLGPHLGELHRHRKSQRAPKDRFAFQVFESLQSKIKEVPGPTSRVEDANDAKAFEKGVEDRNRILFCRGASGDFLVFGHEGQHLLLRLLEVAAKWSHEHGLDKAHDRVTVRIVGAQLRALARVQASFEEGTEDGRLHLGPVQAGDRLDQVNLLGHHGHHLAAIEKPSVEPLDVLGPEETAVLGHLGKQVTESASEDGSVVLRPHGKTAQETGGKQAGIFGKHAEEELVEKVSDFLGLMSSTTEALG
jgi:hypothetical protein